MSTNRRILNLPLITSGNVTGSIVLPLDDPSDNLTKKINLNQVKDFVLSGSVDNNYYTTGSTLINGIAYFNRNDQLSAYTLNLTSLTGDANTYLTAVTYNQSTNTITLTDNTNTNFNAYINSVSGLTVNGVLSATTISGGTLYGNGSNLTGISTYTYPTYKTGNTVTFDYQYFYNSRTSPGTGNITENLTGAQLGVVQKIYHNDITLPSFPAGWILVGSGTYTLGVLNIIMCEWIGGTSTEYWILQDQ